MWSPAAASTAIAELDGAFAAWLPIRRGQVHRTHGQVIAVRAEPDRAALIPLPDAAVSGDREASAAGRAGLPDLLRGVAATRCRPARSGPGSGSSCRSTPTRPPGTGSSSTPSTVDGGGWLATHPRAARRGAWVVDPDHWAGLPDGHTRATIVDPARRRLSGRRPGRLEPLAALLHRRHADIPVAARPLTDYHTAAARS